MHFDFFLAIVGRPAGALARELIAEGEPWFRPRPGGHEFNPPGESLTDASLALFLADPRSAIIRLMRVQNGMLWIRGSVASDRIAVEMIGRVMEKCGPIRCSLGIAVDESTRASHAGNQDAELDGYCTTDNGVPPTLCSVGADSDWLRIMCGQRVLA